MDHSKFNEPIFLTYSFQFIQCYVAECALKTFQWISSSNELQQGSQIFQFNSNHTLIHSQRFFVQTAFLCFISNSRSGRQNQGQRERRDGHLIQNRLMLNRGHGLCTTCPCHHYFSAVYIQVYIQRDMKLVDLLCARLNISCGYPMYSLMAATIKLCSLNVCLPLPISLSIPLSLHIQPAGTVTRSCDVAVTQQ